MNTPDIELDFNELASGQDEVRSACLVHLYLLSTYIAVTEAVLEDLPPGYACDSVAENLYQLHRDQSAYLALFRHMQQPAQAA